MLGELPKVKQFGGCMEIEKLVWHTYLSTDHDSKGWSSFCSLPCWKHFSGCLVNPALA